MKVDLRHAWVAWTLAACSRLASQTAETRDPSRSQLDGGGSPDSQKPTRGEPRVASRGATNLPGLPEHGPSVARPISPEPAGSRASSHVTLDSGGVADWIALRLERAKKGEPERVRVPLVHRSDGWGCVCPSYLIGTSPITAQGPFVEPSFEPGAKSPKKGEALWVEGSFGGSKKRFAPGDDSEEEYEVVPLRVFKTMPLPAGADESNLELQVIP